MIRADYIFTFWVLFWYIFYLPGYITASPKLAFYVLLTVNLIVLLSMVFQQAKTRPILYFILIILATNLLPLVTLDGDIQKRDIMATAGLFVMFIGWLIWADKLHLLKDTYTAMLDPKCSTPMMCGLTRFFS